MLKTIKLLCLPLVLASSLACGKAYSEQDVMRVFEKEGSNYAVNFATIQKIKQQIAEHAANYPTTFETEAEKQQAAKDATALAQILMYLIEQKTIASDSAEYRLALRDLAQLGWYSHNMDIEHAAAAADNYYQQLLSLTPASELAALKAEYGSFLASTGQIEAAISMMQAALNEGEKAVEKALGMAYLAQGDKAQALKHLRAYQQNFSNDSSIAELIEAVEDGRVEIKTAP